MKDIINFALKAMDDDQGINEEAYDSLKEILLDAAYKGTIRDDFPERLDNAVNATEGRYYIDHDDAQELLQFI